MRGDIGLKMVNDGSFEPGTTMLVDTEAELPLDDKPSVNDMIDEIRSAAELDL